MHTESEYASANLQITDLDPFHTLTNIILKHQRFLVYTADMTD